MPINANNKFGYENIHVEVEPMNVEKLHSRYVKAREKSEITNPNGIKV